MLCRGMLELTLLELRIHMLSFLVALDELNHLGE